MQRPVSHRIAPILIFLTIATASSALPANASHPALLAAPSAVTAADVLTRFRAWLGGIWPDSGCILDPNGTHHCQPGSTAPAYGCTISPNGVQYCAPGGAAPANGCIIDPNGAQNCAPGGAVPNAGCGGDPSGAQHCG
jgi:hypothetical protein